LVKLVLMYAAELPAGASRPGQSRRAGLGGRVTAVGSRRAGLGG